MPALAAIRKKPQKSEKQPREKALNRIKPEARGKLPPEELMEELARLVFGEGMPYARAYLKVFPHRKPQLRHASTQAHILVERWVREHKRELQKMLPAHDMGEDRLVKEMAKRYKANTLREVVKSEVIRPRGSKGKPAKPPFVLTTRETIEVEDNATRMRATELHADVLGARKSAGAGAGIQQNVAVIYVVGGKIKKKRQERIVGP